MMDFARSIEGARTGAVSHHGARIRGALVCSLVGLLSLSCKHDEQTGKSRAALSAVPGAAASLPAPVVSAPAVHSTACEHLHILEAYREGGALNEKDPLKPELNLPIDLHNISWIAPDTYGHEMKLTLELAVEGQSCRLLGAHAKAQSWDKTAYPAQGAKTEKPKVESWENSFVPAKAYDLANRGTELEGVELRDEKRHETVLLLVDNYWFFEKVRPGRKLTTELPSDNDKPGTSHGYTYSEALQWRTTHYLAPAPFWYEEEHFIATGEQLDDFNRWASRWDLRSVLEPLAQQAFGLDAKDSVEVTQQGDAAATVQVIDLERYHPTNRYVRELKFSRQPCTACSSGYSGWSLWAARGDWECREEDQSVCSRKLTAKR